MPPGVFYASPMLNDSERCAVSLRQLHGLLIELPINYSTVTSVLSRHLLGGNEIPPSAEDAGKIYSLLFINRLNLYILLDTGAITVLGDSPKVARKA